MTPERAPEIKSATTTAVFDEFMRTFAQFRDANDQRLAEIETRLGSDVITSERVDRINSALDEQKRVLDELALKAARPALSGEVRATASGLQHKAAFDA